MLDFLNIASALDSRLDLEITKMTNAEAIYMIVRDIRASLPMLQSAGADVSKVYPTYTDLKKILDDIEPDRVITINEKQLFIFSVPTPRLISQTVVGITPYSEDFILPQYYSRSNTNHPFVKKVCGIVGDHIILCNLDMTELIIGCTLKNLYAGLSEWRGTKYQC